MVTIKQQILKINNDIKTIKELKGKKDDMGNFYLDNCDCGDLKLVNEDFCPECEKKIKEKFSKIIIDNFDIKEIKVIDKTIEGYLMEELFGKEN